MKATKPVKTANGRSVFVRDPDNFILQVIQAPAAVIAKAFFAARQIFRLDETWRAVDALDRVVPARN